MLSHYKSTIKLGLPIMLGQLGIIIVGFVDNIMVAHHSTIELAAVSFVNNFFNLVFVFGMGFSYGLTPVVGRWFACKNYLNTGKTLKESLLMNAIVGLLLSFIMWILLFYIDWMNQPVDVVPYIRPYYSLQLCSIFFVMLFNSFKQFFDATMDTLTPMWVMLIGNVVNIVGNYWLIFGKCGFPEMGLEGAGISTLFSRILTLLILFFCFLLKQRYQLLKKGFVRSCPERSGIFHLVRLGLPVGLLMGVETASFSLSVILMGWLGNIALAAHQVTCVITTLGFMVYYGIAAAVSIRICNLNGRGELAEVRKAAYSGLHLILFVGMMVIVFLYLFREKIGYLITPEEDVVKLVALLVWPLMLYQMGDGLQILFANALRGISDVQYMAVVAFICHLGIALPLGYVCGFVFQWGALGVWCGFPVSLTLLGLLLWNRFNRLTQ